MDHVRTLDVRFWQICGHQPVMSISWTSFSRSRVDKLVHTVYQGCRGYGDSHGDSNGDSCGYGMGMGIEMPFPRQPCVYT